MTYKLNYVKYRGSHTPIGFLGWNPVPKVTKYRVKPWPGPWQLTT
jgi:hypothetical protein